MIGSDHFLLYNFPLARASCDQKTIGKEEKEKKKRKKETITADHCRGLLLRELLGCPKALFVGQCGPGVDGLAHAP